MPDSKFQVGDTVTWTSQAGGKSKTKTGKVIKVVDGRNAVGEYVPDGFRLSTPGFYTRDHRSYLIQVGKSKRLYWPLVKYLEKIHDGPQLQEEFESLDIAERKDGSLKWIAAD